eukprot:TRINITY_DN7821_c0_g1_i1.p1 TRINITY_DN7821_c0_g1~~TRINITY_DN7821_c0_g1_i1.p1  ORF type:complete len:395 (+),score=111.54 TRINITY_DN7821_c0_g1_i1:92-1276(+)
MAVSGTTVKFAEDFDPNKYTLWQLDEHVLETIEAGDSLEIKGQDNDAPVLCTSSRTYAVKIADTTDGMYLLQQAQTTDLPPELMDDDDDDDDNSASKAAAVHPVLACPKDSTRAIIGQVQSYFELKTITPDLTPLRTLLSNRSYLGPDADDRNIPQLCGLTFDELLHTLQMSRAELIMGLNKMDAFQEQGRWMLLDDEYQTEVLDNLLTTAEADALPLNQMSLAATTAAMTDFNVPQFVLRNVMSRYGEQLGDNEDQYALKPDAIVRFRAEQLLKIAEQQWYYDAFMAAWKEAVPEGMAVSSELLRGLALVIEKARTAEDESAQKALLYLPSKSLPVKVKDRLTALFRTQPVWTEAEIRPYLKDIETPQQTVDQMLFKHCREFTQQGVKMYNQK